MNTVCGTGSTGKIVCDISRVMTENHIDNRVLYGRGTAPVDISSARIGGRLDMYRHALFARVTDRAGLYSRRATRECVDDIKAFAPDVIHLHNIHGYYLNYEVLFQFLADYRRPVIWTLHDMWAVTGHCVCSDYIGCDKWKTMCSACPQKNGYPSSYVLDRSRDNYIRKKKAFQSVKNLTVVTPSNWLCEQVKQSFLGHAAVRVINNGIDLTAFSPCPGVFGRQKGLEDRKIVLSVLDGQDERKGIQDMYTLARLLPQEYQVVIVGLTGKQVKALPREIIGIERTDSIEQLAQIYSDAFVFVNPTYEDNFPTVNLEALACGIPVITYRTGGSPESLTAACGYVAKQGDVEDIARVIQKRRFVREDCIAQAQLYNKDIKFKDYMSLYNEVSR